MSALFKQVPPDKLFEVPGTLGKVEGWRKVIAVGGEVKRDARGREIHETMPPLAPSRFAEQLRRRRFTNGADFKVVCDLVRPAHATHAARASPTSLAPLSAVRAHSARRLRRARAAGVP